MGHTGGEPFPAPENGMGWAFNGLWNGDQVKAFLLEELGPRICLILEQSGRLKNFSVVLYGSRARGDAQSDSDFDLAVFCKELPDFQGRNYLSEKLYEGVKPLMDTLDEHGAKGSLSLSFLSSKRLAHADSPPALYFSIVQDGLLLCDSESDFATWRQSVESWMKKHKVSFTGAAKSRVWRWLIQM